MATSTVQFDPRNFPSGEPIDNNASNYLQYKPGTVFTYNVYDAAGNQTETRVVTVTDQKISIDGVTCTVIQDVVTDFKTGKTVEIAMDYVAQDKLGNVWYFGEDVQNFKNGKFVNFDGSWHAGQSLADGTVAGPGIIMEAKPKVGDFYRQENATGIAQDTAQVLSLSGSATVPYGSLSNLLVTLDLNPLDLTKSGQLSERENKYYAAGIGEVYSETYVPDKNGKYVLAETEQLVSVTSSNSQLVQAMASFGATQSVSSPLAAVGPDQHASTSILATPHHHS